MALAMVPPRGKLLDLACDIDELPAWPSCGYDLQKNEPQRGQVVLRRRAKLHTGNTHMAPRRHAIPFPAAQPMPVRIRQQDLKKMHRNVVYLIII